MEDIFERIGAEVLDTDTSTKGRVVYSLRVKPSNPKWNAFISAVLLAEDAQTKKSWHTDISKRYFASDGDVKFCWRVVVRGTMSRARNAFAAAEGATARVATKPSPPVRAAVSETMEMPLVGADLRVRFPENNLAEGRTRGAYGMSNVGRAMQVAGVR